MRVSPPTARIAYAIVVFIATFTGLHAELDFAAVAPRLTRAFHPSFSARDVVDGLRNVLLFAGLGATWVATSTPKGWWRAAIPATITGFLLSAFVEFGQLFSRIRMTSVLDLITNTGGALVGALVTAAVMTAFAARRRTRSYIGVPAFVFSVPYLGAALCDAVFPLFRNGPVRDAWGGPGRRFAAALEVSRTLPLGFPLIDLVLFVPAGALFVATFAEFGVGLGLAAGYTMVGGTLLAALAELARGAAGHRMEVGAFVAHMLGIALGALLAVRLLPAATRRLRGRSRVTAFVAVYLLVLAVWIWRPFRVDLSGSAFAAELTVAHFIPLYALAERGDLFSVADVGVQFLLYLPLGALAAVWPVTRRGIWRGPAPMLMLALVLELGQLVVSARFFDLTDWLIQSAGVLVGWAVARQTGYRTVGELRPPSARAVDLAV